jgi:hypothetical protein
MVTKFFSEQPILQEATTAFSFVLPLHGLLARHSMHIYATCKQLLKLGNKWALYFFLDKYNTVMKNNRHLGREVEKCTKYTTQKE